MTLTASAVGPVTSTPIPQDAGPGPSVRGQWALLLGDCLARTYLGVILCLVFCPGVPVPFGMTPR